MDTKAKLEQVNKDIGALEANKSELQAQLETEFAEAEKPKLELRHGDYGLNGKGDPSIMIADWDDRIKHCGGVSMAHLTKGQEVTEIVLGNIFDDLTALSEDVEEFELCGVKFTLEPGGHIRLEKAHGAPAYFGDSNLAELVRKLRQMAATAKRKE